MVKDGFHEKSDKRKYGELIHYFSIKYAIQNNRYIKTIQEAVDVMRKSNKIIIKTEVVIEINQMKQVFHKHINMKKCYWCGSGTHMLNNCEITYTIERCQWFDRTENVKNNH